MATYAIGDVQGCFDELLELLDAIGFNASKDCLWFCGDLVNRGPNSLETLRFVRSLKHSAITVLGNHDLHAIAVFHGVKTLRPKDTLHSLMVAPDAQTLIDWLEQCPLVHYEERYQTLMVHAGIPAAWNLSQTLALGKSAINKLRNHKKREFLTQMYGNEPSQWSPNLKGFEKFRYTVNSLTRMRYCYLDGRLNLDDKSAPGDQPSELIPWFKLPHLLLSTHQIIFGHWASLQGECSHPHAHALDTGCVWGGTLTALCLETCERVSVPSHFQSQDTGE